MNQSLYDIVVCPTCHSHPKFISFESMDASGDGSDFEGEIISGVMRCACAAFYPIIDGVPRFLEGGVNAFPEFESLHAEELKKLGHKTCGEQSGKGTRGVNDYDNIRQSFSQEWGIFDYNGDKTWGWTLEERKRVFVEDMGMRESELSGRRLLDAGCGNGTLTAALSDFDLDVVGLDLNDDLGRAFRNRDKLGTGAVKHVQYVQGNLVNPPLMENSLDLIYSSGVIHHTPSSEKSFDSLVRLLKPGGRIYVWVYGKRALPVRAFFWMGRSLKSVMSLNSVLRVCQAIAPIYKVSAGTLNSLGIMRFRSRSTREITLDLFDAFAPRYNHWHTEAELRSWFEKRGLQSIHVSGIQKHGFGMYGDKP